MDAKEIEELAEAVRHHNRKYWIEHKPEISDSEYDKLVSRLRQAAPFHSVLDEMEEDEPAVKAKIQHEVPMLSLDKLFSADEVAKWAAGAKAFDGTPSGLVVSYKVDGSSCSLLYEDGKLVRAATRGNGKEGDDITANALVVQGVPKTIPNTKKVEVRGEIYMTNAAFAEAVERFEKKLAAGEAKEDDRPVNPRNYCAGSIKQKNPQATKERKLSFMAHGLLLHGTEMKSDSEDGLRVAMEKLGFETPFVRVVSDPAGIAKIVETIAKDRKSLPYETDGIVFGVNRLATQKEMGCTSHHPRYKIAFKFAREQGETQVAGIKWETSRTGRVVPTVELKPIHLGGATVTFCTGHNAKNIRDLKLVVGDTVLMEREVIPYLVKKTAGNDIAVSLSMKCQSCGSTLSWDETETDLVCDNAGGCQAQLYSYLCHYVSRKVVNIVGVGEELIEKLLVAGLVKSPADFYRLSEKDVLAGIERQGESSAKKIVGAIQERREQSLATFLYGLGIPLLGNTMSEKLAEEYKTLDAVLAAKEGDLLKLEKVGEKLAAAVVSGLKSRAALIADLLKEVKIKVSKPASGPLAGKSFCLTGHVEFDHDGKHYDSRPDIEDMIKAKGGSIKSVSKGLDFLVAGDEAGSKLEKAGKLGVAVIDGKALAAKL